MKIVILGLSITSSWGNGHAVTYRSLMKGLCERGHHVLFLERNMPWCDRNRDLPQPRSGTTDLYDSVAELKDRYRTVVTGADLVIVGSYVPEGVAVGEWVTSVAGGITAFYDLDTPVTLGKLDRRDNEYLSRSLVPRYDLYLSFTGGPTLARLQAKYRARLPRVLYCSVDESAYYPEPHHLQWDLAYLGTYSNDRQPALERLLIEPARTDNSLDMCIAGSMYPDSLQWPGNVERIQHIPPERHRAFYNAQRFTLNVMRSEMVRAGFSPSIRLFEAAACGTPIVSDPWDGLGEIFTIGSEILVARSSTECLEYLRDITEDDRIAIGERARQRVLAEHTSSIRAAQLEAYVAEVAGWAAVDSRAAV